jgi:predicted ABC-type ATPase
MVAGPNGSGKSTLTKKLAELGIEFGEYLNADDIAASLTGSPEAVAAQAQAEVRQRRNTAVAQRRSHCFETVMSHPSHIDFLKEAKAVGFDVRLFFVATEDPEINVGRVSNRVLHGGHDVPSDRIVSRYLRCLEQLPSAIAVADQSLIFDNSSSEYPLRLLAEFSQGRLMQRSINTPGKHPATYTLPQWWRAVLPRVLTAQNSIGQMT